MGLPKFITRWLGPPELISAGSALGLRVWRGSLRGAVKGIAIDARVAPSPSGGGRITITADAHGLVPAVLGLQTTAHRWSLEQADGKRVRDFDKEFIARGPSALVLAALTPAVREDLLALRRTPDCGVEIAGGALTYLARFEQGSMELEGHIRAVAQVMHELSFRHVDVPLRLLDNARTERDVAKQYDNTDALLGEYPHSLEAGEAFAAVRFHDDAVAGYFEALRKGLRGRDEIKRIAEAEDTPELIRRLAEARAGAT